MISINILITSPQCNVLQMNFSKRPWRRKMVFSLKTLSTTAARLTTSSWPPSGPASSRRGSSLKTRMTGKRWCPLQTLTEISCIRYILFVTSDHRVTNKMYWVKYHKTFKSLFSLFSLFNAYDRARCLNKRLKLYKIRPWTIKSWTTFENTFLLYSACLRIEPMTCHVKQT